MVHRDTPISTLWPLPLCAPNEHSSAQPACKGQAVVAPAQVFVPCRHDFGRFSILAVNQVPQSGRTRPDPRQSVRRATVLPTPTSPVITPRRDSPMQKTMRATASWASLAQCSRQHLIQHHCSPLLARAQRDRALHAVHAGRNPLTVEGGQNPPSLTRAHWDSTGSPWRATLAGDPPASSADSSFGAR